MKYLSRLIEEAVVKKGADIKLTPTTKRKLKYGTAGTALGIGGSYAYLNRETIGNKLSEWGHDIKQGISNLFGEPNINYEDIFGEYKN